MSRLGAAAGVASSRRGGGNAVVLDCLQVRPGTCRGGASSWTHPCSWTQRELSKSPAVRSWSEVVLIELS